jgi:dynein heavy chain
LPSD